MRFLNICKSSAWRLLYLFRVILAMRNEAVLFGASEANFSKKPEITHIRAECSYDC